MHCLHQLKFHNPNFQIENKPQLMYIQIVSHIVENHEQKQVQTFNSHQTIEKQE